MTEKCMTYKQFRTINFIEYHTNHIFNGVTAKEVQDFIHEHFQEAQMKKNKTWNLYPH